MAYQRKTLFCQLCGKSTGLGYNRPKSLHRTKRLIHPNIQLWNGLAICNRCRRTLFKDKLAATPAPAVEAN